MVNVRPYAKDKTRWEVDIAFRWPSGTAFRLRVKATVESKSAALREGLKREAYLLTQGEAARPRRKREAPAPAPKVVPTLEVFQDRYLAFIKEEGHKASARESQATILRLHLIPSLGPLRLDEITSAKVADLHAALEGKARRTRKNVLQCLRSTLKAAEALEVIASQPCKRWPKLKVASDEDTDEAGFYEPDDYAALVAAAAKIDVQTLLVVLLGGQAGLRRGEMLALRLTDVRNGVLKVERNDFNGVIDTPKSGHGRKIPLTHALQAALTANAHLRGPLVLCRDDGSPRTKDEIARMLHRAQRRANLAPTGLHLLRHSFLSHLAMRGASPKAIQKLAGHSSLTITTRYLHLSPDADAAAIALLNPPKAPDVAGEGHGEARRDRPKVAKPFGALRSSDPRAWRPRRSPSPSGPALRGSCPRPRRP
jgi:integrase